MAHLPVPHQVVYFPDALENNTLTCRFSETTPSTSFLFPITGNIINSNYYKQLKTPVLFILYCKIYITLAGFYLLEGNLPPELTLHLAPPPKKNSDNYITTPEWCLQQFAEQLS